jgi:uncharacterized integral membrane protein (TIGR00697 family)
MDSQKIAESTSILDDKRTLLFIVLGSFFVANALLAEFIGIKVFSIGDTFGIELPEIKLFDQEFPITMSAGAIVWPLVFIMTDIINEYFGRRGVKLLSYITILLIGYVSLSIFATINLEPPDFWVERQLRDGSVIDMDVAFNAVLGQGLWITIGSLVAFLIGQFIDIWLFFIIKKTTGEKYLWLRATGSTFISQIFDSFIVLFISYSLNPDTQWDLTLILSIFLVKYIYKMLMAVLLTPIIYLVHNIIDWYLGEPLATELKNQAMKA